MRTLRQNLVKAYEVHEWLTRREARKYSLVVRRSYFAAPLLHSQRWSGAVSSGRACLDCMCM